MSDRLWRTIARHLPHRLIHWVVVYAYAVWQADQPEAGRLDDPPYSRISGYWR